MDRLGRHVTLRDVPLWLAVVGLAFLALSGVVSSLHDPSLAPIVAIVVVVSIVLTFGGRVVVRRLRYNRITRVVVAMFAFAAVVILLPLTWVLLPASLTLLAIEMMAPPPIGARPAGAAAPAADRSAAGPRPDTDGFDWPEEPKAT